MPLLEAKDVKKYFNTPSGLLHAVDGISLALDESKTIGVVGESGCGKSTLGRVLIRLLPATSGEVFFENNNILELSENEMDALRRKMQIIFQDPYSSLNPRMTVSEIIAEPIIVCKSIIGRKAIDKRVRDLMGTVGIAKRFINTYPHELDGGRRQRIGIARALALDPKFIVCDEPVSALDVSIQAQIINLMMDLQDEFKVAYMFITHDLSVVRHISHDIMVMYLGECVERAPSLALFDNPLHPYTRALLEAIPVPNLTQRGKPRKIIRGEVTSPVNPKPGCRFASRCPEVKPECAQKIRTIEVEKNHFVACTLFY